MRARTRTATTPLGPIEEMSASVFDNFRKLILEHSGISLNESKRPLVKARIQKRMRALDIHVYEEYLRHVMNDLSGAELQLLLDAISTNVTNFYRERHHFDFMRPVIEEWLASGQTRLRIWSAACSTGEEPYTIAIEVLETIDKRYMDIKILATDIASKVLRACQRGEYSTKDVEPIPAVLRSKYFTKTKERDDHVYTVSEKLRSMVHVRQFNLIRFPFAVAGPMDLVFCRNVMIYFDRPTRAKIVGEFSRIVRPGGYLFVGHSESLTGLGGKFTGVRPSVYRRH